MGSNIFKIYFMESYALLNTIEVRHIIHHHNDQITIYLI